MDSERLRNIFRGIAGTVAALLLFSSISVVALRWLDPPATMFMLLDPLGPDEVAYQWTDWSAISPSAPLAVVASEDQKFPSHFGFDLDSIRDSLDARNDGAPLRGASTISQQVAKNLFLWPGRSMIRKAIEAYLTLLMELTWSKRRILEIYLNVAEFGRGIYGVGAASREYFDELPAQLTDSESALLAAVLPNPKRMRVDQPSPYVRERQNWILTHMQRLRRDRALASLD